MRRGRVLDGGSAPRYIPPDRPGEQELLDLRAESQRAGFTEGFARGREEGRQSIEAEQRAVSLQLADALERVHLLEQKMVEESKDRLLDLVLLMAARIVRERIDAGDEVAARVVNELLARTGRSAHLLARLHPDDIEAVKAASAPLSAEGALRLVADPQVGRGGVILETEQEQFDGRIETALSKFRDAMEERE